eukprot:766122-Hanusia_phi.AAC.3
MARLRLEQGCSLDDEDEIQNRLKSFLEDAKSIEDFIFSDLAAIASQVSPAITPPPLTLAGAPCSHSARGQTTERKRARGEPDPSSMQRALVQ